MMTKLRGVFAVFVASLIATGFARADGIDKMYDYRENFIDEFEIIGDVYSLDGQQWAMFEMKAMQMRFYLPPQGVYVQIDENNPIIRNRTPFRGYWTTTAPRGQERWGACPDSPQADHDGRARWEYGDAVITNNYLENGDLYFSLEIGHCDDPVEAWAFNNPALDQPILNTVAQSMEICGNERDLVERALGCSDVIAHPEAPLADVAWAHWSRAYVRCSTAPKRDIVADLMAAVRIDPLDWQKYYRRIGEYHGPLNGQISNELYAAAEAFADRQCR